MKNYWYTASCGSLVMYWKNIGPHRFKINSLATFSGKFIYADDKESTEYNRICEKNVTKLIKNVVSVSVIVIFAHLLILVGPIYAYIFKDMYITPLATHLPFLEKDSSTEFLWSLAQQCVIALYSITGNLTVEIITCLIIDTVNSVPELIWLNLKQLADGVQKEHSRLRVHIRLRNVLIQAQDLDRYLLDVVDVYYVKLFEAPFLWTFSISLSIFAQFVLKFPAGYGIALCCYVQILIMCNMGNNVKNSIENVAMELYDMPWYLLTATNQKHVSAAIHRLQNGPVLTIGPLGVIDFV
ncbi:uncharacterized protein LOC129578273 [Sitodiplosis mosellana]|uniref:uncharacterized protein LOC129578273 n=1 Tax=Sitodiplosis mosellana TaxID=263140 RepID=UPI002444DC57|nr:uncharacterized protein LOC129578273 [Sitodiplosis mosellana]